ncbi:MAG: alpha/beta hydrolase [Frankiales bacterium]|nr:alpha/beta hydrolase [Frankiales bacterium]
MTSTRQYEESTIAGLAVSQWHGSGPTVLALAGLTSSGRAFGHLATRLSDLHIVGPHLSGRGGSRARTAQPGLRGHAQDVARVVDQLDLQDIVVVGHSMGAYLAPLVAQEAAGRVARLVLIDGGIPPELPFYMSPRMTRLAFGSDMRKLIREWPSVEHLAAKKLGPLVRDRPDLRPLILDALAQDFDGEPGPVRPQLDGARCVDDAVDTFFGPDTTSALEALAVPAHLITTTAGKKDGAKPFLAQSAVDTWTARLPQLTSERVTANHVTVLFSERVLEAVRG